MSSKAAYQTELKMYETLKKNVLEINKNFKEGTNIYNDILKSVKNIFSIDNAETPVYQKTKKQIDEINGTLENLEKIVLPEIEEKMSSLREKIRQCEIEEARLARLALANKGVE